MKDLREDAKNVKTAFIKSKFVEAAKTIILRDGVQNVTVRGLAEITGYSYPMVYHYFRDLNGLLLETKLSMVGDMVAMGEMMENLPEDPLERQKAQARGTIVFFIENPNVFRFFYQNKMDEENVSAMRSLELEKRYYDGFAPFVGDSDIRESDIPTISRAITYIVFGAVTLFLSDNGLTREETLESVDRAIEILLRGKRKV